MAAAPQSVALALPDFQSWLYRAKPGEKLEYYRGDLAYDRECRNKSRHDGGVRCGNCERCVLNQYAWMILTYGEGERPRVHLVQRRNRSDYSYFAIKGSAHV